VLCGSKMKISKPFSILIVDDNAPFALRLKYMLESNLQDDSVNVSFSFEDALNKIIVDQPSLVLLDVRLGERSGISLLKMIKEKELPVQVIMISNQLSDLYRDECRKLGAHLYLDKMRDLEKLPEILNVINS